MSGGPKRGRAITVRVIYPQGQIRVKARRDETIADLKRSIAQKLDGDFPASKQSLFDSERAVEHLCDEKILSELRFKNGTKVFMRPVAGFISASEVHEFQQMIDRRGGTRNYERVLYIEERMGTAKNRGLRREEIEILTTHIRFDGSKHSLTHGDVACMVCLQEFEKDQSIRMCPLEHCFHESCFAQWLATHDTCPVCMRDLRELTSEMRTKRRARRVEGGGSDETTSTSVSSLPREGQILRRATAMRDGEERVLVDALAKLTVPSVRSLPYEGSMQKAIAACDREAVRALMRERTRIEKESRVRMQSPLPTSTGI